MRRLFLLGLLICSLVFSLSYCGGDDDDDDTPDKEDPEYTEDGVTGGTFTSEDGKFQVIIADDSMPAALRAQPEIEIVDTPSDLLEEGEKTVSSSYDLNLDSIMHFITTQDVTMTVQLDNSSIPAADQNAIKVYIKVFDPDNKTTLWVPGSLSGSQLTLKLKGLPKDAIYTVVYNPNLQTATSSEGSSMTLDPSKEATAEAPWSTNLWISYYNPRDPNLRTVISGILNIPAASLTDAQIQTVIVQRVSNNGVAAGAIYQAAGFRQPNLQVIAVGGKNYMPISLFNGGSKFEPGGLDESANHFGFSFGILYVGFSRIADTTATNALGTVFASVAHEMFHSVQNGYDTGFGDTLQGSAEGSAATYGVTIDTAATTPQVRSATATETHILSNYLLVPNAGGSEAYSNQDFFAYVGRVYNNKSLSYLQTYYAKLKAGIDALVADGTKSAPLGPPWDTVTDALDATLQGKFKKDLATVYAKYARDRAIEHSSDSVLRSGETAAGVLNTNLFSAKSIVAKTVDPEELKDSSLTGAVKKINEFATKVLKITPTKAVENGVDVTLTLSPSAGAVGNAVRAAVYRAGAAVGTEMSGNSVGIKGFGVSTGDVLTVVISNAATIGRIDVDFELAKVAEETTTTANSFSATIKINGANISFDPKTIVGGFGTFTGDVKRINLPTAFASEGASATDLTQTMVNIITDPDDINAGNTYNLNETDTVFEQNTGSASIIFNSPKITHDDNGEQVVFGSTGGTITLTSYGETGGSRMTGTFTANMSGKKRVVTNGVESDQTLTGTISGSFDVLLEAN
ncbi:MAG: hypothetical protein HYS22_07650 [Deltaproteobacteria bacterium]|nr:hypothetical protein [Deltaproteobacteria bacterium]